MGRPARSQSVRIHTCIHVARSQLKGHVWGCSIRTGRLWSDRSLVGQRSFEQLWVPALKYVVRKEQAVVMGLEVSFVDSQPSMDNSWRNSIVTHDKRTRIVNRIMDTLHLHMPIAEGGIHDELLKIVWRYEEKTFQVATDPQDYLQKISLMMLSLETKGISAGRMLDLNEAAAALGVTQELGEENGEVINERA